MSELNGVLEIRERMNSEGAADDSAYAVVVQSYRDAIAVAAGLFECDNITYDKQNFTFVYATPESKKTLGEYHRGAVELILYMHGLDGDCREYVVADIATKMNFR